MKILQISSIYPVTDEPEDNPYVYNFIKHYRKKYGNEFTVLNPVAYLPSWLIPFTGRKKYWKRKKKVCQTGVYQDGNASVHVLPYVSVGSVSFLHAFFSHFAGLLNKKRIRRIYPETFDIIHAHYLFPDGLIAYQLSKKYNIPYALTIRQELRFLADRYSLGRVKKLVEKASVVTTHSPQMLKGLKKAGIVKAEYLSTGIETCFFENEQIEKSGKVQEEKLKLLSVCNLLPVKNLEAVIRAIGQMPDKEKIDYTIYGTGPLEQDLKELVSELQLTQLIHFKGAIENKELPAVMPKYDVFIQPSFKETLGLTYFEALACGLPVILTKNTGAYELIKDKEVYYVVDPYKPETITACLHGILSDRETLARKSAQAPEVAKIASWEGFVGFFHERYEEIIKR